MEIEGSWLLWGTNRQCPRPNCYVCMQCSSKIVQRPQQGLHNDSMQPMAFTASLWLTGIACLDLGEEAES
jgi:hypothetical protein